MSKIGVVTEQSQESRVSATPETVKKLLALGYEVLVEKGAGVKAAFPDSAYNEAGAKVVAGASAWKADIVLKVDAPTETEVKKLQAGTILVGLLSPAFKPELLEALAKRKVTALAMDAVPRISRAQSMDVLSSMANIAGYRAVIEAAHEFGRRKSASGQGLGGGCWSGRASGNWISIESGSYRQGNRSAPRGVRSGSVNRRRVFAC
jgi:NAD(P) transhydrogenase subunit alpha